MKVKKQLDTLSKSFRSGVASHDAHLCLHIREMSSTGTAQRYIMRATWEKFISENYLVGERRSINNTVA